MSCKHQTLPKGKYCSFCGEGLVEVCELYLTRGQMPCTPRCKTCKDFSESKECSTWCNPKCVADPCPCSCHKPSVETHYAGGREDIYHDKGGRTISRLFQGNKEPDYYTKEEVDEKFRRLRVVIKDREAFNILLDTLFPQEK